MTPPPHTHTPHTHTPAQFPFLLTACHAACSFALMTPLVAARGAWGRYAATARRQWRGVLLVGLALAGNIGLVRGCGCVGGLGRWVGGWVGEGVGEGVGCGWVGGGEGCCWWPGARWHHWAGERREGERKQGPSVLACAHAPARSCTHSRCSRPTSTSTHPPTPHARAHAAEQPVAGAHVPLAQSNHQVLVVACLPARFAPAPPTGRARIQHAPARSHAALQIICARGHLPAVGAGGSQAA